MQKVMANKTGSSKLQEKKKKTPGGRKKKTPKRSANVGSQKQ